LESIQNTKNNVDVSKVIHIYIMSTRSLERYKEAEIMIKSLLFNLNDSDKRKQYQQVETQANEKRSENDEIEISKDNSNCFKIFRY
jgi:hypothetical protein